MQRPSMHWYVLFLLSIILFFLFFDLQQGYYDALRAEVASDNIKVSIVSPGPVESEIWDISERDPRIKKVINHSDHTSQFTTKLSYRMKR